MNKYEGVSFEKLSSHADEGWDLANRRTVQLREAVEALRGAEYVINAWAYRLGDDWKNNVNLQDMIKVLGWGKKMFQDRDENGEIDAHQASRL